MTDMTDPKIIDGKVASLQILAELAEEILEFSRTFRPPHLAVILVGEDPASQIYVRGKMRSAKKSGIESTQMILPAETTEEVLLQKVDSLNMDDAVDGIVHHKLEPPVELGDDFLQILQGFTNIDIYRQLRFGVCLAHTGPRMGGPF